MSLFFSLSPVLLFLAICFSVIIVFLLFYIFFVCLSMILLFEFFDYPLNHDSMDINRFRSLATVANPIATMII